MSKVLKKLGKCVGIAKPGTVLRRNVSQLYHKPYVLNMYQCEFVHLCFEDVCRMEVIGPVVFVCL